MGAAQRPQPAELSRRQRAYGLGTRPPLTSASSGNVANVTAGNRNSLPAFSCARAHEPLTNRNPSMSPQATVRLPSSVRTVTECGSATVLSRTINAESSTGIASSGAVTGQVSTGTSRPSVKKPTAMCAIGEILITTGAGAVEDSLAIPASFHCDEI